MEDKNNSSLAQELWSETELLALLDIDRNTLDELRANKQFPYIRLSMKKRVYLASSVLAWIQKSERTNQG